MNKYKLEQRKWGVIVLSGASIVCMVDEDFPHIKKHESAMDYCKRVFLTGEG